MVGDTALSPDSHRAWMRYRKYCVDCTDYGSHTEAEPCANGNAHTGAIQD